jgi:hypothetical protein
MFKKKYSKGKSKCSKGKSQRSKGKTTVTLVNNKEPIVCDGCCVFFHVLWYIKVRVEKVANIVQQRSSLTFVKIVFTL